MSGNFLKEDLRVIKTQRAFQNAIVALLQQRKFKQITVNDLCEEALTSRAAFYKHFKDKYDLLEAWFLSFLKEPNFFGIEGIINFLIYDNSKVMRNIIYEADGETLRILNNFISLLLNIYLDIQETQKKSPEHIILSKFYSGGIYEIIVWQVNNDYPQEMQSARDYLHGILKNLLDFHKKYKKSKEDYGCD